MNGNGTNCDDEVGYIITWISLGFVGIAIIFIMVGIAFIEIRMRIKLRRNSQEMRRITDTLTKNQQGTLFK